MATNIHRKIVLSVSGKEAENSFNGLSQLVGKLGRELKKLTPGTKEFMDKAAELKEARAHFERVKNEINGVNTVLDKGGGILGFFKKNLVEVGTSFRQFFTANLVSDALQSIISYGSRTAGELLKISDAMADVQKTTGMALEEVKGLWDAFDEMDTRTSKMDRLKIAEVGGRLGVSKEQMASFVQEVDKAYVALGDSFQGGLENVVDSLGKIKGLFNETKGKSYAEAINEVGSALNELAASGTASEGNISDFALRVGALPDALKPSIDKVLGLGAAFEESGVDSQIAASGYSNFIKVAGENLQNFAHSMNMSYEEAQKLFNEKPEEFFLRFAQGMRDVPAEQTALIFDSLKIGTLEVQKAVGAAANRTDEFREAMARAGSAMQDATSLNEEFSKKNNNAAAIVEKLKNAFTDLFSSTNIINMFEGFIKAIGWLTGVTNEAGNGVIIFKEKLIFLWNIIKVATVAILGYNASILITTISTGNLTKATWLKIVADKAEVAGLFIKRTAIMLYNVILGICTLNLQRITAATIAFNVATKANPLGVIITLISTAIIAYQSFSKEVDDATKKQKELNDINTEANKSIITQKNELDNLLKVARDETASKEARLAAIKRLNEISPEYLGNLNLENINTQEATNAVNAYTEALYRASKARVLQKKMDEKVEAFEEQKKKSIVEGGNQKDWLWKATGGFLKLTSSEAQNLDKNMFKQMEAWTKRGGKAYAEAMMKTYEGYYESYHSEIKKSKNEIDELGREIQDLMKQDTSIIKQNTIAPTSGNGGKVKTNRPASDKAAEEAKKKAEEEKRDLEDSKKRRETAEKEVIKLSQELEEEKLKIKQTTQEKEIEDAELARQKELTAQKEHGEEILNNIKELEEKIKNAKSDEAKKNYTEALAKEREASFANDLLIAQAEETHQKKLAAIREKYRLQEYQKNIEAKQVQLEKDWQVKETEIQNITTLEEAKKKLSEMKHLELTATELRNIKTLEDAKKALRENAAREMLKAEIKAIEEQKAKLNELLKDPTISPEALEQLHKDLNEVDSVLVRLKGTLQGKKEEDTAKK